MRRSMSFMFFNLKWFDITELHVKTVKYFKSIERVQDEVELRQAELKARGRTEHHGQVGSME
jgi:glucosamine-6-phosphate deaminase